MAIREDFTNQIFGNRLVIKNYCVQEDWTNINKPIPKEWEKFRLTKCLNCGALLPADIRNLKKQPPKRCAFCSNIGNHYNIKAETNNWVVYDTYAACNIMFKNEIITFYIDIDDYDKISKIIWRVNQKRQKFYIVSGSNKKNTQVYLHNLILPQINNYEIDHIDGNSLNNRKANLRYVNHQTNIDNTLATRIDNQIGIRGISYNKKSHLYKVDFQFHNKRYYLKDWQTIEEAIYCRYCCEKIVGLKMLEKNPNFQYYDFSKINSEAIENYVKEKISGN